MLSRVLGLVREQLFAALLGASALADAFLVAFRIPNLLRDLFAEGALSQAFVPTFKRLAKNGSPERAYQLGNRVAGTLVCLIGALVLAGILFAPQLVHLLASEFAATPGKFELTVLLTRMMLPFLIIVSVAAVLMGMLNAQEHYATPALAPAMFNVCSIAGGLILYFAGVGGENVAIGWAIATIAGGLAQAGIQLPALWRRGFRPRFSADPFLRNEEVRKVALLMAPAVVGAAAVQLNIIINTWFASQEPGAVSWLNYGFRFLQLPIGVFGVAIATVATTRFADAAAGKNDVIDKEKMTQHAFESLKLVIFLTVPSTAGLLLLGEPIIGLIFERGRFTHSDTIATTLALQYYAIGLTAYASVKIVAPAFYAIGKVKIPLLASVCAVATNIAINFTLHPIYGFKILAFGTAAAAIINIAILLVSFQRHIGSPKWKALLPYAFKIAVATIIMGAVVWTTLNSMQVHISSAPLLNKLALALVPIILGIGVFFASCLVLRVPEATGLLRRLRRRSPP